MKPLTLNIKSPKTGFLPKTPVVYVMLIKKFWDSAAAKNSELPIQTVIEVLKM